ncbi:multidrug efflux system [Escherichia coli]|nr:multidrug efflux system [Escherichia coli]
MPQLLQETIGYNAIRAGLAYAPIGIMPLLNSPCLGRNLSQIQMLGCMNFTFVINGDSSYLPFVSHSDPLTILLVLLSFLC